MGARKAAALQTCKPDLNKIVTESYSKSTKANTKRAAKVFQGKYSDIEIHFRLQNSVEMDLIAVVRFLGVVFVHSDQHARAKVFLFFNYLHFYAIF